MTTLENARLGVRVEIRKTAEETDGALFEFDVVGRARGLLTQTHVHMAQTERHEVVEGSMRLVIEGREHILRPGDAMTVPVGAKHRQLAGPGHDGPGRVRVQLRPAGDGEAFVRRLAELDVNRWGFPKPLAAAQLVRDFGHTGHAAQPPVPVQRALSRAILALASREHAARPRPRPLTPLLRPALRWNHAWAIARAVEGLEPYARARSATTA